MANKDFRRLFALLPSFLTVINRNNRLIWQNGKNHTLALQPSTPVRDKNPEKQVIKSW